MNILSISISMVLIFNVIFNFTLATFLSPGTSCSLNDHHPTILPYLQSLSSSPTHCKHCDLFKPDRSHHCSICNKCIFKMDHHCRNIYFHINIAWINNCIGHLNLRYFLLMILYCWFSILL